MVNAYDIMLGVLANQPDGARIINGYSQDLLSFFAGFSDQALFRGMLFDTDSGLVYAPEFEDAIGNMQAARVLDFQRLDCRYFFDRQAARSSYEKLVLPELDPIQAGDLERIAEEFRVKLNVE